MFFSSPQIKSGFTIVAGFIIPIGLISYTLSVSQSQRFYQSNILSTVTNTVGKVTNSSIARFPPNIFTLLFGANAFQTANSLVIDKRDLIALTANANNTAESLLVALIYNNLINKRKMFTPKIDLEYWGYGYSNGKRIDTVIINFYNPLTTVNTYEIADYDNNVNPNNY